VTVRGEYQDVEAVVTAIREYGERHGLTQSTRRVKWEYFLGNIRRIIQTITKTLRRFNSRRYPGLWLGRNFPINAYMSFVICEDDGSRAFLIRKPSGEVWIALESDDIISGREEEIHTWMPRRE
jgi:hypothetical protein